MLLTARPAPLVFFQIALSASLAIIPTPLPLFVILFALLAILLMELPELAIPATHPVKNAQAFFPRTALLVLQLLQFSQEVFVLLVSRASTTT